MDMDFEPIISRFQQLASTRGGAVLTAIMLISTAVFATGLIGLTTGIIDKSNDIYKNSFIIFMLLYFLLLALVIFKVIRQKPKAEPTLTEDTTTDVKASRKTNKNVIKNINLERLSAGIVVICLSVLMILVYAFVGLMTIKDSVVPAIQNISNIPFEWEIKYLGDNILIPLTLLIMWVVMPFAMYLNFRVKGKRNK